MPAVYSKHFINIFALVLPHFETITAIQKISQINGIKLFWSSANNCEGHKVPLGLNVYSFKPNFN